MPHWTPRKEGDQHVRMHVDTCVSRHRSPRSQCLVSTSFVASDEVPFINGKSAKCISGVYTDICLLWQGAALGGDGANSGLLFWEDSQHTMQTLASVFAAL